MTNMQEEDQENEKRNCNRHKSLTSVYFSKLFSKKEDSNHDKQFGKLNMLVSNILQSIIRFHGSSTLKYYMIFRIESRTIESM